MADVLRRFGSTGLQIGPIGLGTVNFSWLTDERNSFEILDLAFERGVNFIDTSDNYNAGATESLLGQWFTQGGGRREKTVLATKVYSPPNEWGSPDQSRREGSWVGPNQKGLSAKHIREACEASLRRLKTDYIDVYQMHHIDRSVRPEEVWQAFEVLIAQGKVLYIGSSNFAGWNIAHYQEAARRKNMLGLVSEQSPYNLMNRTVELEVIPACSAYEMAFLPYSPLAEGILAGKKAGDNAGRRSFVGGSDVSSVYQALCRKIGHSPAEVALAWLAGRPGVTAPMIGPRTQDQLTSCLSAIEIALDHETLTELDQIFPGPGGAAPEAYAW